MEKSECLFRASEKTEEEELRMIRERQSVGYRRLRDNERMVVLLLTVSHQTVAWWSRTD